MLPAKNRLKLPVKWDRNRADFQFRTNYFKIIAKKTAHNEDSKVGFIITTKVGKATVRNSIKRNLSARILPYVEQLGTGVELIIIVYPSLVSAQNEEISSSLDKALSKIHL